MNRLLLLVALLLCPRLEAQYHLLPDEQLAKYFKVETDKLREDSLSDLQSGEDWIARRGKYRSQLFEMLGLDEEEEKTDLKAVVTGKVEHPEFVVEKIHFQSRPGLYVTANFYVPKRIDRPVPTILYLSGHGPVISNGVSYGNKVSYQHHGIWFARHGYACLILDTLQLGEIEGLHHGTYREGMWWWNSRGYTPAGVEAWNCIRALDYLETRKEVDAAKIGATGRSGGGAYSWWVAALDDRIKAAAPVAGITDLHNHVVDGVVEGHCDCMYMVNTYRWDYGQVAALVAPRPLLLANTDNDTIFPLDGVMRIHSQLSRLYKLLGAKESLGLIISPGGHKDTQDLQIPVFRWFNRHLKSEDPVISIPTQKLFKPEELRVFATLPSDERNTKIHYDFVPLAKHERVPQGKEDWQAFRYEILNELESKSFGGWPVEAKPVQADKVDKFQRGQQNLEVFEFISQEEVPLRFFVLSSPTSRPQTVTLRVIGNEDWTDLKRGYLASFQEDFSKIGITNFTAPKQSDKAPVEPNTLTILFSPRGIGYNEWKANERKHVQIRRRFMLLGQTLDGMQAWDIRRGIQAVNQLYPHMRLKVEAGGQLATSTLLACLYENSVEIMTLSNLPSTLMKGPDYLNALKVADMDHLLALALEKKKITLLNNTDEWPFATAAAKAMKVENNFIIKE